MLACEFIFVSTQSLHIGGRKHVEDEMEHTCSALVRVWRRWRLGLMAGREPSWMLILERPLGPKR